MTCEEELTPTIGQLIEASWTETEQARERYESEFRRMRVWRRWLIGMVAFYALLIGYQLVLLPSWLF